MTTPVLAVRDPLPPDSHDQVALAEFAAEAHLLDPCRSADEALEVTQALRAFVVPLERLRDVLGAPCRECHSLTDTVLWSFTVDGDWIGVWWFNEAAVPMVRRGAPLAVRPAAFWCAVLARISPELATKTWDLLTGTDELAPPVEFR